MDLKELFIKLLKFRSITPEDDGAFDFIAEYLNEFKAVRIDKNGIKNLFLYKKFGDGEHLSFAGHIDVVPPGSGWKNDPFLPFEKDGFIYARGTQDMKGGVAAFLQACKDTKNFKGTLSLILTSDEEGKAEFGTLEVLKYLKNENFLPDFCIVAEPSCENKFGDTLKIGRRGSINAKLLIKGTQGHAAYPERFENPINKIAPFLDKIAGHKLDNGDEFFSPSQIVITDIRAGMEVANVTPNLLKIMFNVRNSTKTTANDIKNYILNLLKDTEFELELEQNAKPFITNKNSKVVINLTKSTQKITKISPTLSTKGGTSDARFLAEFGVDTIELGVRNDTIHAINERVLFKEVQSLYEVFLDLIENFN